MALIRLVGIVVFFQLAQAEAGAVVHGHFDGGAGIVVDGDVLEGGHEADFLSGSSWSFMYL